MKIETDECRDITQENKCKILLITNLFRIFATDIQRYMERGNSIHSKMLNLEYMLGKNKEVESSVAYVADEAVGVSKDETSSTPSDIKKWYVAYVGTRAEKAVRDRLNEAGIRSV